MKFFKLSAACLLASLFISPQSLFAQTTYYPANGIYNGFLGQLNIVECNNNNDTGIEITLNFLDGSGSVVEGRGVFIPPFGAVDTIVNDTLDITDKIGAYTVSIKEGQEELGNKLSCRTSFYRGSQPGSSKIFEYAYVLPVENASFGSLSGIFDTINPVGSGQPVANWLSILNYSDETLSGTVRVYNETGSLVESHPVSGISSGGRQDVGIGFSSGSRGTYVFQPEKSDLSYDAFLIRYDGNPGAGYNFAFPAKSLPGSCPGTPLLASSMGNGLTDNYLEVSNLNDFSVPVQVEVRDQFGALIERIDQNIGSKNLYRLLLSDIIDPQRVGRVGSARVICEDPNDELIVQSTYFGKIPGGAESEWAYSTQDTGATNAGAGDTLSVPVNTFLGFANWLKLADSSSVDSIADFMLFDLTGEAVASGERFMAGGGTIDIGIHEMLPPDRIGTMSTSIDTESADYWGEVLRVLNRVDGQIGSIVRIPGKIGRAGINSGSQASFIGDPQSLAPYKNNLSFEEAKHLQTLTKFGGPVSEVNQMVAEGLQATVDRIMTFTEDPEFEQEAFNWIDGDSDVQLLDMDPDDIRWSTGGVETWWLYHMVNSDNAFKERMSFIWHDLFALGCSVIEGTNRSKGCYDYLQLIRENSLGNFRLLLRQMNFDYAMLVWLNGFLNSKEAPDENYAREHWELFSMGERTKHDGRYPLYTEADIAEAARAFTGWKVNTNNGLPDRSFDPSDYDTGVKTLWAGTPFETSGVFDNDDLTELTLTTRPEAARFIVRRLFSAFAHDNPSHRLVNQMAEMLVEDDFEVENLVRRILTSEAMFSTEARKNRIKDPLSLVVGFMRDTGFPADPGRFEDYFDSDGLGLTLLAPPDVSGWPMNKYQEAHESEYFLGWTFPRSNILAELMGRIDDFEYSSGSTPIDGRETEGFYLRRLVDQIGLAAPNSAQVVDFFSRMMGVSLTSEERTAMMFYLDNSYDDRDDEFEEDPFDIDNLDLMQARIAGLLWLLAEHDDYQRY